MKPHLERLANQDQDFKTTLQEEGFIEDSDDSDLIWALHKKYKSYKARVLVITGYPHHKMEIIDLVNTKIKNELPAIADVPQTYGSVGGLLQGKPIICGQTSKNMLKKRDAAASVVLNPTTLWVVGGAVSYTHLTLPTTPYV